MRISTPNSTSSSTPPAAPQLALLAKDLSNERLARGARDNLAGIVLERVFGVVLVVSLSLLLAPAVLGQYYEAMALLIMAAYVAMLGLDVGLIRFTALSAEAGRFGEIRTHLWAAVIWGGGWALGLAAGLWVWAPLLSRLLHAPELAGALRLGAVGVPFFTLSYLLVAPSKGLKRMADQVLVIQVVAPAVQATAALLLVIGGTALAGAVGSFAIAAAASFAVAVVLVVRLKLPKGTALLSGTSRDMVRFSAMVSGTALLEMALLWIDTLLLGAFRPPAEVAVYGLMVRMMMVPFAIVFAVIQIFGPFVTQLLARGERERLEAVLRTSTRWAVLLAVPILALLAIDGGKALALLHQRSSVGGLAVIILAVAFMIDALTGLAGHVLTMSGRSGVNAVNSAVALVANVGLNLALIPRWGILGAALSWSVVIIGVNLARMVEVRVLFRISPLSRSLMRPMAAVGLATGITFAVRIAIHGMLGVLASIVLDGCVLLAVYAGAVALYGHAEDRMLIRTILRRPARVLFGAIR